MERKLAKMEGTQETKEMTSEHRRGRMAHTTARNGKNRNDAFACLTRTRGLEYARMMRTSGRHVRVARKTLDDAHAWTTRTYGRRVRVDDAYA